MIDLRQLRYFVAIVEHSSFSRAAEMLHIAQPALFLHVRNMETELDVPLLLRTSRGVKEYSFCRDCKTASYFARQRPWPARAFATKS